MPLISTLFTATDIQIVLGQPCPFPNNCCSLGSLSYLWTPSMSLSLPGLSVPEHSTLCPSIGNWVCGYMHLSEDMNAKWFFRCLVFLFLRWRTISSADSSELRVSFIAATKQWVDSHIALQAGISGQIATPRHLNGTMQMSKDTSLHQNCIYFS